MPRRLGESGAGPSTSEGRDRMPAGWAAVPGRLRTTGATSACFLVIAAAAALVGWVLVRIAPVTLAVTAALFLTALLHPVVAFLGRLRVPRALSALGALVLLVLIVAGPLTVVANQAIAQSDDLRQQLVTGLERLRAFLTAGPLSQQQLDAALGELTKALQGVAPGPLAGAMTTLQTLAAAATALVLLFFFLRDGPSMWEWIVPRFPSRSRERVDAAFRTGWSTLVAYVRGTVTVAAVDGFGIGLALVLLQVPLGLALGFLTFLFAFVPIVGAIVAGAVAVLVALVSNGVTDALLVLAAVVVVQQLEGNLLAPVIIGKAVHLHPAVVLLGVTAGTLIGGIAGAVVTVPLIAVAYRTLERGLFVETASEPHQHEKPGSHMHEHRGQERDVDPR
ncbi:Predicted PurR-regulated permease PerM [Nonomuraea maritima]|uniref:Predicted PurR-regulated permease PerM n=2 Tax=Nonomuraea maritima TaxID=683260 RepID=A0A1G9AMT1_9ACTN|nr:Predicted PurR-regulated permease PerM [Nonomuraea maritima]